MCGGVGTFAVLQGSVCVCVEGWVPLSVLQGSVCVCVCVCVCVEGGYPCSFTR